MEMGEFAGFLFVAFQRSAGTGLQIGYNQLPPRLIWSIISMDEVIHYPGDTSAPLIGADDPAHLAFGGFYR